ncbi:MAG: type II secretion system protein [Pirellulaceae bacterium]|nr:type II secretion system protein [Pirellulaceae bacterium]
MSRRSAFTLVEILIVVVILAILAAAVIPQFSDSTNDAKNSTSLFNLNTFRSQIAIYRAQHGGLVPTGADAAAITVQLTSKTNGDGTTTGTPTLGPYLQAIPNNTAVVDTTKQALIKVVIVDPTANDAAFGWIYNKANGNIFSAADYLK